MKITIFGASGRTGQQVVQQALQRGHQVTAFSRSPSELQSSGDRLNVVEGDIRQAEKVSQAIEAAEAVISVLGPTENKPTFAVTEGTGNIIKSMRRHNVNRLILTAGAGVTDPKDEPRLINRLINFMLKATARWVYEDMQRTVSLVRHSELDWTVVRVPRLTDGEQSGQVNFSYVGRGMGFQISRANLAQALLDILESGDFSQQAPVASS